MSESEETPPEPSQSIHRPWTRARIAATHNTARFFVENRSIAWVLLVGVLGWGLYGYQAMPKQKDPTIPVRVAVAITPWPGVDAKRVELLVTKPIEDKIAENSTIYPSTPSDFGIQSLSLPGLSVVQVQLDDRIKDVETQLNDIDLRLIGLSPQLPEGAGPIRWNSGFGETAALMLTIASPPERDIALDLRADAVASQLEALRREAGGPENDRVSAVVMLPRGGHSGNLRPMLRLVAAQLEENGEARDARMLVGAGFGAVDVRTQLSEEAFLASVHKIVDEQLDIHSYHPDAWDGVAVRDLSQMREKLHTVAGPRFTYEELGDFSDLVARQIQAAPEVSKVLRAGVLNQRVEFTYSQDDLVALGISPAQIEQVLEQRNEVLAGGRITTERADIFVSPTGDFRTLDEIGKVMIGQSTSGSPLYLNQVGDLSRGYQDPPGVLNYYQANTAHDHKRGPAVTLAIQMREGQQIGEFSVSVDAQLAQLEDRLPEELVFARTSDQPRQVEENIDLFMGALYEAVILVVIVALIGFRDWRSSLLLMISIPLTLAMTFGAMSLFGVHLQQISIATLIIALGLLVDDPVVANDAVKRELADGEAKGIAAWLGPTKLARAIMYATITNVAAYLPFLLLTGTTGTFLWSLPVVMGLALVASRLVSMTFIPFLAYHLLKKPAKPEPSMEVRRSQGWTGRYYRFVKSCLEHRYLVLSIAVLLMLGGFVLGSRLETSFFPDDVQYLFTVDVWAPTSSGVPATDGIAANVERSLREGIAKAKADGLIEGDLVSITTFVGAGAPRFWQTVAPEQQQSNYAQLIIEVENKDDTPKLVPVLQRHVESQVPGAWIDVKQLQLNPVAQPISFLLSSHGDPGGHRSAQDLAELRRLSDELVDLVRQAPSVERVRSNWLGEQYRVAVDVDPDLANLSGMSNSDVSQSIQSAFGGVMVSSLHDGDTSIPMLMRMRRFERPSVEGLGELYIYDSDPDNDPVPLSSIATMRPGLTTERIWRREHFRTATIYGFARPGHLSSEVFNEVQPHLDVFIANLPPGFTVQVGGEHYKQQDGFKNMTRVMAISAACIFVALVFQLSSLVKPWIVFAGVPFGFAGGLASLYLSGEPFGFMAFLGLVSLVGIIVSHVIVLNDFIEERLAMGEPLIESLLDAGLIRLRPVLITVGATVLALVPLAREGGPLWRPLCFAQMGGLTIATAISLLIVPVLYAVCALDLGIIKVSEPTSD